MSLFDWFRSCDEGAHKFEPRFEPVRTDVRYSDLIGTCLSESARLAVMFRQVYIHDVCVRCGVTVQRPKVDPP